MIVRALAGHPETAGRIRKAYISWLDATASIRTRMPWVRRVHASAGNEILSGPVRELRTLTGSIRGRDNIVTAAREARIRGMRLDIVGEGNRVVLGAATFEGLEVIIRGDGNRVEIGGGGLIRQLTVFCEDDGNVITAGERFSVYGTTELAAIEGTKVSIGDDCLFAAEIHVRTGDSHSLLDGAGLRINPSADVVIGDHVWIGRDATLLKGSGVAVDSVIAACAVVTKRFSEPGCVVGGNPARIIRQGISWAEERVPVLSDTTSDPETAE